MRMLLKGGQIYENGHLVPMDIEVTDGIVTGRGQAISSNADKVFDCRGYAVFPGFADVHVHLREPGFSYKETIGTGTQFVTDGYEKYIWYPALGKEQFFDLREDPQELNDLVKTGGHEERVALWRQRLIDELEGRPEGFVEDGKLKVLPGPTPYCVSQELMDKGCNLKDTDNGETTKK